MNDDELLVMSTVSLKKTCGGPLAVDGGGWREVVSGEELKILTVVCITHICVGYAMGAISPAMEAVTTDFGLNDAWRGVLGSAALAGNMLGSPMGGSVADTYGRRACIISAWTVLILGSLLQALSPEILMLCCARALVGWAVGAHYAAITTYLSETLNPRVIGRLLSFTEFNFFLGNFAAIAVGAFLNATTLSPSLNWRLTLLLSGLPSLLTLTYFAYSMPESPHWLRAQAKQAAPAAAETFDLEAPPSHDDADHQFMPLRRAIIFVSAFWGSLVAPTFAVSAFAVAIISELGLSLDAFTLNTFLAAAVASGVALGILLVDLCGRKSLLLLSQWGVAAAFFLMAILQPLAHAHGFLKLLLVLAFFAFEVFNGCGAPLALVYPAEIFPPAVKGLASGISAMNSRILAIAVIMAMSALLSRCGVAFTLLGLAALSAAGALVTHALAPRAAA